MLRIGPNTVKYLFLLTALLITQLAPPRANGAIEGTVEDSITMLPLPNAPITVTAGTLQIDSISDQSGRFLIPNVAPGPYVATAKLDGYSEPAKTVIVIEGQISHVNLTMVPSAIISGSVFDDSGAPLVDAAVQVMRVTYRNGIPTTDTAGSQASDGSGGYRITGLRPGDYYVAAAPKPSTGTAPATASLVRTFSPSGLDLSQASVIRLRAGEEMSGVNVRLEKANLFRISGQVSSALPDIDTRSGAMSTVTLLPRASALQDNGFSRSGSVSMASPVNGRFELANVFPGVYDLYASLPDSRGYGGSYGRTTVTVSGDQEGVIVNVHRGVDVRGTVTVDGGTSPSINSVRISLLAEDSASRLAGYQQLARFQPTIDPNGAFTIPTVPEGQYRIQVAFAPPTIAQPAQPAPVRNRSLDPFAPDPTPPPALVTVPLAGAPLGPNAYVAEILQGGMTVFNTGIFVGTQSFDPLDVKVRTDGGSVSGIVLDGKLIPFGGATVALAPLVQHRQNPALYRVAVTDETGSFSMSGIRPGEYKLLAWDSIPPGAYMNAEFLSNYADKEYPVTVSANIQVQTKLTVITQR